MILFFSSFIQTEFSLFTDSFTTIAPTNGLWSIFLIYKDICDQILVYILICGSIVSDLIITHIYSILIIPSLTLIILFSGAANKLGQKLATYIGVGAGIATIYSGTKEVVKDVGGLFGGTSDVKPSSQPSGSTPSGSTPSGSTPSGSTPSGSTPSSNNPSSGKS
jgi:hypothetical protein